jgi:type II secretory pathway pseudopilin PulG
LTIKARDTKRKQDLGTIQQALELYFAEKGVYPTTPLSYTVGTYKLTKKHLSEIPTDPGSGKSYVYAVNGTTEYELAAAMEMDGNPVNFQAYVIGNAENSIAKTINNEGVYYDGDFKSCTNGKEIRNGDIIGPTDANGNCMPYDPRPN